MRIVLTQQLDALGLIRKACNNLKTVFFSAMFSSNVFTSSTSFNLSTLYSNQLCIIATYILKIIYTWINREKVWDKNITSIAISFCVEGRKLSPVMYPLFYEFIVVLAGLPEKFDIFKQLSRIFGFCLKYCIFLSRRKYFQKYKSYV